MKRFLATLAMTLVLSLPAKANDEIEAVISAQIEAFLKDDFATAFTFASPAIKGIFGTPERFGQMVRDGYPMVWRPSEVEFLGVERIGEAMWQTVLIRDAGGALYEVEYEMIPGEDGWKINGVRLRKAKDGLA